MKGKVQAVILAGGLGTRLRTVVNDRPKAMACFAGKPFLEYQIAYLKRHQIDQIILCVGYLKEKIQEYFQDGRNWGVTISYAVEDDLLGTAGALRNAERHVKSHFLTLNGDSFFELDLSAFRKFHEQKKSQNDELIGTIALVQIPDRKHFGSVVLDSDDNILTFEEKPVSSNSANLINAGIYMLEPQLLQLIPRYRKVSLEKEVFPSLLKKRAVLAGFQSDGFFVDIGSPEGFFKFQEFIGVREDDY